MVNSVVTEVDAVPVLQRSVHRALEALLSGPLDPGRVNKVLANLAGELGPVFPYLNAIAAAEPRSAVRAALDQVSISFTHAAADRSDQAVTSLMTASMTAYRLADIATLDAVEAGDRGSWR